MELSDIREELKKHHSRSFGWALHCCQGDVEEAEEILQSAYLRILSGQARFEARSSFRTWLFSVIRLTSLEARRRWLRRAKALERWWIWGHSPSPPDADRQLLEMEFRNRMGKLLAGLSGRQRDVLHLVFYQDMTLREAASTLGISLGSVRAHYHRGKVVLRRRIEESGETHDGLCGQGNQSAL